MTTAKPNRDTRPAFLLTGFGPFPGIRKNASADLVKALARQARRALPDYRFVAAILPTEWARGQQRVEALHERLRPIAALHFGVAAEARGFRIERHAANQCRRAKDAAGAWPDTSRLSSSGPEIRHTTFDVEDLAAALGAEGFPVELSDDAGGYLCNAVFYRSLNAVSLMGKPCSVGFIHIPADLSRSPLDLERAVSGALQIVKLVAEGGRRDANLTSA